MSVAKADFEAVKAQLGREPRGLRAVAHRCPCGNPDVVMTRSRLLESAWDWAYEGTSNIVDQYVRYLRRKIDEPFHLTTLETVRGVGYRFNNGSRP